MSLPILDRWTHISQGDNAGLVFPDGCQDLIMRKRPGFAPEWHISELFDQPKQVMSKRNECFIGFRLSPGAVIDSQTLLALMANYHADEVNVADAIAATVTISELTTVALNAFSVDQTTVEMVSSSLGVNVRSLQRHFRKTTGKPPRYWLSLARVRRAARLLLTDVPIIQIAADCGYVDQSHMCRDFKRWFNISPACLQKNVSTLSMITASGLG